MIRSLQNAKTCKGYVIWRPKDNHCLYLDMLFFVLLSSFGEGICLYTHAIYKCIYVFTTF